MDDAPSSIGPYVLDAGISDLPGLIELSPTEYLALPKRFPDEHIFNAPNVVVLGHEWAITIATRGGRIRKIFAEGNAVDREQGETIFYSALGYWFERLGEPTCLRRKESKYRLHSQIGSQRIATAKLAMASGRRMGELAQLRLSTDSPDAVSVLFLAVSACERFYTGYFLGFRTL